MRSWTGIVILTTTKYETYSWPSVCPSDVWSMSVEEEIHRGFHLPSNQTEKCLHLLYFIFTTVNLYRVQTCAILGFLVLYIFLFKGFDSLTNIWQISKMRQRVPSWNIWCFALSCSRIWFLTTFCASDRIKYPPTHLRSSHFTPSLKCHWDSFHIFAPSKIHF